jgi:hypothetical protein
MVLSFLCDVIDVFPTHAGCYYILGFILFVLNQLEEATILLQMGRAVDPSFEPIDGKNLLYMYWEQKCGGP